MSATDTAAGPATRPMARMSRLRLLQWSIRRELWENRSIYMAPLIVAALMLLGFVLGVAHAPHVSFAGIETAPAAQLTQLPYVIVAAAIVLVSLAVGVFYCLGALHGERRDRSLLFWKSLPVSDLIAVAAKAAIPLLVLPAVAFVVILFNDMVMMVIYTLALLMQGVSPAPLWALDPVLANAGVTLYGLVVVSLWYAPLYGWLLLVSAWARRTPILWALAPMIVLPLVEKLAFNTNHVGDMLNRRLHGGFGEAFVTPATGKSLVDFLQPAPLKYLATPELWIGLAVAAAFLAGAVWRRRRGEPI